MNITATTLSRLDAGSNYYLSNATGTIKKADLWKTPSGTARTWSSEHERIRGTGGGLRRKDGRRPVRRTAA